MQAPVWKGRAERLTTEDFGTVAAASGVEAAALRAIWEVEAAKVLVSWPERKTDLPLRIDVRCRRQSRSEDLLFAARSTGFP